MNEQVNNKPKATLGVNYWPRRTGLDWWRLFDRGEVAEDFLHIRSMGLSTVRIFPLWGEFQPEQDRLNHKALDSFGTVLDLAAEAGLGVLPVLLSGLVYGTLWLPGWMVEEGVESGRRIVVNGRDLRHAAPKRFYDQPALRRAQILLVRELVGYFSTHPALWGWELGQRVAEWALPPSPAAAQDWLMGLAEATHRAAPGARLAYTSGEAGLVNPLHINDLAEAVQVLGWMVDAGASDLAQHPLDVDANRVGLALLRALAGRSTEVMISAAGLATVGPDQAGRMLPGRPGMRHGRYAASESEQAEFVQALIEAAWQDHASALWLPAYSDYPPSLWVQAPLDLALRARTAGLTRTDGSEKPVVASLRDMNRRLEQGQASRPTNPARQLHLDPDAYYGTRDAQGADGVASALDAAVRRWRDGGD